MALLSIRLDGSGEEQVLAPPVAEISISEDGKKLAYARPSSSHLVQTAVPHAGGAGLLIR